MPRIPNPIELPEHFVNSLYNIGDAMWGIAVAILLVAVSISLLAGVLAWRLGPSRDVR